MYTDTQCARGHLKGKYTDLHGSQFLAVYNPLAHKGFTGTEQHGAHILFSLRGPQLLSTDL